jgi:hypothetical protein
LCKIVLFKLDTNGMQSRKFVYSPVYGGEFFYHDRYVAYEGKYDRNNGRCVISFLKKHWKRDTLQLGDVTAPLLLRD